MFGEANAPGGIILPEFYNQLGAMRVKQDAVPGIAQPVWFTPTLTGEWEIACSQLCGLGHYRMRGFYSVQSQADYDAWFAEETTLLRAP